MNRANRGFIQDFGLEDVTRLASDATGSDTYQMEARDRVLFVDSTLGIITTYLPPVGESFGKIFLVQVETYASVVTVAPYLQHAAKPDSVIYLGTGNGAPATSQALAADEAYTVLFCTGKAWIALCYDLDPSS